jgi:hypothetical protein
MADDSLNKQGPCWDGYVQRGMKPGENGSMVPNCVPVEKADTGVTPTQPRSTDAIYPGIGVKRPTQGKAGGTTGSNVKSKYGKKPKKINRGTISASGNIEQGGIVSGGGGGSMGTKADDNDFWAGSAFEKR